MSKANLPSLKKYFKIYGQNVTEIERLISAAKPIADFFGHLGLSTDNKDGTNTFAKRLITEGKIFLSASLQLRDNTQAIVFQLGYQGNDKTISNHSYDIEVDLNESGNGRYRLISDDIVASSGDPKKIISKYIDALDRPLKDAILPLKDAILPLINKIYGTPFNSMKPLTKEL